MGDDPGFTWINWDKEAFKKDCQQNYNMTPKFDWALDYFGGRNPSKDFLAATNIVFANGELDPWHAGGVTKNITTNTIALFIENSAHHLDLRLPNPDADPASVTSARALETAYVKRWVEDFQGMTFSSKSDFI